MLVNGAAEGAHFTTGSVHPQGIGVSESSGVLGLAWARSSIKRILVRCRVPVSCEAYISRGAGSADIASTCARVDAIVGASGSSPVHTMGVSSESIMG